MILKGYDDKVGKYWPEFSKHGKRFVTIAEVMRYDHCTTTPPAFQVIKKERERARESERESERERKRAREDH